MTGLTWTNGPASVALATPDTAPRRAVVVRHFPSPQLLTRRPRLSLVQSVAEYGCTPHSTR